MYHSFIKVDQGHQLIICLKFTSLRCYTAKREWNKDSWHRWPV